MGNMKKRRSLRKPGSFVITAAIVLIVLYGGMNFSKGLHRIWRLSRMKKQELRAIEQTKEEIGRLEDEIVKLRSDSVYIEEIARREYGMVKNGEEVFHITLPDTMDEGKNDGQ